MFEIISCLILLIKLLTNRHLRLKQNIWVARSLHDELSCIYFLRTNNLSTHSTILVRISIPGLVVFLRQIYLDGNKLFH